RALRRLRREGRLRRVRRRQTPLRRRALLPRLARNRTAAGRGGRPAVSGDGERTGQPEERDRAAPDPRARRGGLRRLGSLPPGGARGGPAARGRLLEQQLPRGRRRRGNRGAARGAHRRDRRRARAPARQARAGHLPRGCASARRRAGTGGGVRGRARGRRGRPGGWVRLRRRRRPGGPGGGAARTRRRPRRLRPRGAARAVIEHPAFAVEPWALRETKLHLDVLAQAGSVFALSNGHIGLRGNLDEGEPNGLPGTYLNGVYEERPLPYAEA